jgi:anti-sigma factor RsiW
MFRDDLHMLTGSYVLDALTGREREEFEGHLPFCPSCDAEVRGMSETAARPRRLMVAVAGAGIAAAVGLGASQVVTQHQLESARAVSAAITRVVTAPDARIQTGHLTAGGTVTVVVSFRQRAAVVTTTGLGSLPPARVYQLWVMSRSGARSAGLFSSAGPDGPLLASDVGPGDQIGITVEPAGGTPRPTTAPVAVVALPA